MNYLQQPFQLGSITLPSNIFCAPLAGCSDLPFRKMTTQYRPGLVYCEMVKMDALIRNDPHTFRLLDFSPGMHPIGGQICGSKAQIAGKCAKMIEELGFDVVDLNCGCPVDKVTKDGSGSALLRTPELIGEILSNMVAAVKIPVTVKIRAGWDSLSINAAEITKIAEQAGAVAICIHGRTRAQGYKGPAVWDYIRECKEASSTIKIIGNGDVTSGLAAKEMFSATGCDAILLARATMGKPWVIDDVCRTLLGLDPLTRTYADYREKLMEHFQYILSYQPEKRAMLDMRRVGCWYLKQGRGAKSLREALNRSKSTEEVLALMAGFSWESVDFSSHLEDVESQCEEVGAC